MTVDDITALPAEDAIQHHDRVDEQDERFQEALHQLAVRCGNCGEPVQVPVLTALEAGR